MKAPGELHLKPLPHLWLPVSLLVSGAVFLLVTRSEVGSQVLALLLVAIASALVRHIRAVSSGVLILMEEGAWRHSEMPEAVTLLGSSARLLGVFWLHGRLEDGAKRFLMVLPGMLSDEDYRRLCVWFEQSRNERSLLD